MNVLFIVLLVLVCLLLLGQVANLVSMPASDAFGRGLSHSLGVLLGIGLWLLLAALLALARTKGAFPSFSAWAVLILVPASFAAMMATNNLLESAFSERWLAIVAAVPPLALALFAAALWFPMLRLGIERSDVNSAIWGSVLLLSAVPWACMAWQSQKNAAQDAMRKIQQEAKEQIRHGRFAALTSNSPLADWLEFAVWGSDVRDQALTAIRQLPRRQTEAEAMLDSGAEVILEMLPLLNLEATPALCLHARKFLCNYVMAFPGPEENPNSLPLGVHRLERFNAALAWLCRQGDVSAILDCIESFARRHPDTPERASFLAELEKLRQLHR